MKFVIFGDIQLHAHGGNVDLGGPRQRTLLALLLVRRNQPTTISLIIEALWADDKEPDNPSRASQTYVSRLRRLVGDDRLTSSNAGYTLVVEPGELDADRFANQIEQARQLRAAGDPVAAAGHYQAAESLWVTSPWAEFADRFWAVTEVEAVHHAASHRRARTRLLFTRGRRSSGGIGTRSTVAA